MVNFYTSFRQKITLSFEF